MTSMIRRTTRMNSRFMNAHRVSKARARTRFAATFAGLPPTSYALLVKGKYIFKAVCWASSNCRTESGKDLWDVLMMTGGERKTFEFSKLNFFSQIWFDVQREEMHSFLTISHRNLSSYRWVYFFSWIALFKCHHCSSVIDSLPLFKYHHFDLYSYLLPWFYLCHGKDIN